MSTSSSINRKRSAVSPDLGAQAESEPETKIESKAEVELLAAQVRALQAANARLREENGELRALALVDPLTHLYNRRGLDIELERALCASERKGAPVALLLIDLDGMKHVNDHLGHPEGDRVLRVVGKVLSDSVRASDSAARLGGDEFAVVMPLTERDGAQLVAERIRVAIEALDLSGITASIGVATFTGGGPRVAAEERVTSLVCAADEALYQAKRSGRNRVVTTT